MELYVIGANEFGMPSVRGIVYFQNKNTRLKTRYTGINVQETSTLVFLPQPKKIDLEITGLVFQE